MTTSVDVRARAWGATVVVSREGQEDETTELGSHQDRTFHLEGGERITVTAPSEAPAESGDRATEMLNEEVPGRRQNDELLRPVDPPSGNESGASETTTTTSEPETSGERRGRGGRGAGGGGADI